MEIWKDVEGYEGLYRVSSLGRVLSLNYKHRGYADFLTPKTSNKGYAWVELRKDKKPKQVLVHRLVAMTFLDNPDNLPQVNHKDENRANNNVENLEWCTQLYNVRYSMKLHPERKAIKPQRIRVTHRKQRTTPIRRKLRYNQKIRQIDATSGNVIDEYSDFRDVKQRLNKNEYGIRECCQGRRKTAYGYKWEFCE